MQQHDVNTKITVIPNAMLYMSLQFSVCQHLIDAELKLCLSIYLCGISIWQLLNHSRQEQDLCVKIVVPMDII